MAAQDPMALTKSYVTLAENNATQGDREYAQYKNCDDDTKWNFHRTSQVLYEKSKECIKKAEKIMSENGIIDSSLSERINKIKLKLKQ